MTSGESRSDPAGADMGTGNQPGLSESEREVLRVLWDRGPGTVRAINTELAQRGRRWAYTTVATLLQRLAAKQYVASDPSMVPHVFRATVTRDELLERRLKDAADELCDGRSAPLVLALVQGGRFSAEELARMRRLLDEAAARGSSPPAKSKRSK
jgi:BlaI family transcriptional regulator, penicillinase repressor